jgi:hypothetical protein
MIIKGTKVYTSDEKDVGTIPKVDREYFTSYKKGTITDKEYRIPLHSMSKLKYEKERPIILLTMTEDQLRHDYMTEGKANSAGIIDILLNIHYEAINAADSASLPSKEVEDRPFSSEYVCDMCAERFSDVNSLKEHRKDVHKGPTGI